MLGIIAASEVLGGGGASYADEVLADTPLAYWRLGDSSGTTCADSSGYARDMTYSGSPTLGVAGALVDDVDTAVTFDGTNDMASIADAAWMDASSITCEAWIKTSVTTGNHAILFRDDQGINGGGRRSFQFLQATDKLRFVGLTMGVSADSTVVIADGAWHHVAATVDGSNIRLYVDGELDTTTAMGAGIASSSEPMYIGFSGGYFGINNWYFDGQIDEVAYYGTALSGERIAAHHAAGI